MVAIYYIWNIPSYCLDTIVTFLKKGIHLIEKELEIIRNVDIILGL